MATAIIKRDWVSQFDIVGTPIISDFTFEIDKQSSKSNYIYSRMNLLVNCGSKHGTVRCEMMGGYSPDNPYPIRGFGKNEDGSTNFDKKVTVEWRDRLDEESIGMFSNMNLITVGLELTNTGKTYIKKFLSEYDAIQYISECITPEMTVRVKGDLEYSTYDGKTSVRKKVNAIYITDKEPYAKFTQSILIDKDSATLTADNIDKDKGVMFVNARVLSYLKEYNGEKVGGNFPFQMQFEQAMPIADQDKCKKAYDLLYKVKKGVTQLNMEGKFVESGATIKPTLEDLTGDIKMLLDCGLMTKDEALAKCSVNGSVERRMVLTNPVVKNNNIMKYEERYTEDELVLDCMTNEVNEEVVDDGKVFDSDDLDWLN